MAWSSTRSGSASWHRVNCTWLVKNMALSAVAVFLRLSWRTVSGIVTRVVAELTGKTDQLDGLRRIGIDKIAYRRKGTGI
jgi:transposase